MSELHYNNHTGTRGQKYAEYELR